MHESDHELAEKVEQVIPRERITADYLKALAKRDCETSIHVYNDHAETKEGDGKGVVHFPSGEPDYLLHSHVGEELDQPSIADLNSAEIHQIYTSKKDARMFIFSKRGITEYRLPDSLVTRLSETGDEFRHYYSQWLKARYGDKSPTGREISTAFNTEHSIGSFHSWEDEEAQKLVDEFSGKRSQNVE